VLDCIVSERAQGADATPSALAGLVTCYVFFQSSIYAAFVTYPRCTISSGSPRSASCSRWAGYKTACTTQCGVNTPSTRLLELKRITLHCGAVAAKCEPGNDSCCPADFCYRFYGIAVVIAINCIFEALIRNHSLRISEALRFADEFARRTA